jgi:phosphonate transport system substrate-binding protein
MKKKGQFFIGILLAVLLASAAYLNWNADKAIEDSPPEDGIIKTENTKSTQKPLYIGFIPQGNAVFMVKKWEPLADYLAKELGLPVETVFRSSYREIISAFSNGEMDICLTGAFMYVLTRQETDIRPLVRRKKFGTSSYHSLVIVRKDTGIRSIGDLQGKIFAFTDKESTTGYLLPVAMMKQSGISDLEKYFSEVIYTGNHDSVLLAVHTRSADGAAMSSTRWRPENPKILDLRIIWKSAPILLGPFSVRGGLDRKLTEKIKKAFLKIGKTPETADLSAHIQIEGFEEAKDSDYDVIRKARKWVF